MDVRRLINLHREQREMCMRTAREWQGTDMAPRFVRVARAHSHVLVSLLRRLRAQESRAPSGRATQCIAAVSLAIALFSSAGCTGTTVYEAAVGYNATRLMPWSEHRDGGFAGPSDTVRFTVRQESLDGKRFCGFTHISHLSAGWPFNDRHEDWLDVVECGLSFRGAR